MASYNKICKTCNSQFIAKRKDQHYCKRICYRRCPEIAARYSNRTNIYQKAHSKEPSRRFEKLIHKCKHEKRNLNIDKETYIKLISNPCTYCHKSLQDETGTGLDRLDNNIDYILTNVVPCCGACNQIRNIHLTHDEMKVAMDAVIEFRRYNEYI